MNENFNKALEASGMSMYALSQNSGVPYTTINEIYRGKKDINQCAAQTVWKLGTILKVDPWSIMNTVYFLDGVRGKYKDIDYVWVTDGTSKIVFEHLGKKVTLDTGAVYNIPERVRYYQDIAKLLIKNRVDEDEWNIKADEIFKSRMMRDGK
ncbi:MAG: helix-turn-helix transcriptional regulator [Firmicutes bacterium]|nr:helix-turn-helix transcriptional regulator [Bacillota bacterium]